MDRATFLNHLRQSALLSEWEFDEIVPRLPEGEQAGPLARALIAQGVLTRYQARQLLAGKPRRLFLGPYRLLEELGSGGMARVYKAAHRTMERVVAIKVLPAKVLKDAFAHALFLREVRAAARLQHPNIVLAYDHNRARGVNFLVMEYVDGPNLHNLVREVGPLPVRLACELMRQAAFALQHAHERGMVHRDIKPANLLIAHLPRPGAVDADATTAVAATPILKVVDFGLARIRGGLDPNADTVRGGTGSVLGTLDYISPEQANNIHDADIRADLYSLGCTFYFALTGQVPFPGGTGMTKVLKHLMEEPASASSLRPDIPAGVDAILRKLLQKDRAARFQTPGELATHLDPWCGSRPVLFRAATKPDSPDETSAVAEPEAKPGTVEGAPASQADSPVAPLPPTVIVPLLSLSQLRQKWWQWTLMVELTLRGKRHAKIAPDKFRSLQLELVEACVAAQKTTDAGRRVLFERLSCLVEPWIDLKALMSLDQEIHYGLLRYCLEAGQEIDSWLRAERAEGPSSETVIGEVPQGFKNRRDWHAFRQRMQKFFGADQ
jgi:serine/threonine protein kinase